LFVWQLLGEVISGDEDDDEEGDGDGDGDEDAYMQKQREKLEAEKEAILNNKNLIAEVSLSHLLYVMSEISQKDGSVCGDPVE